MSDRSRHRSSLKLLLLAALAPVMLVVGLWLGGHPGALPGPLRDAFVGDSEGRLVDEALSTIHDDYYRAVPRRQLVNRSIEGAVRSLGDRFSSYLDPASYRAFQDLTRGQHFSGVGMQTETDRRGLRVLDVFAGSPAARDGIRAGDIVTAVDGRSLAGEPASFGAALIQGPPGTTVELTVLAGGRQRVQRLRRERILIPAVQTQTVRAGAKRVAHITLRTFSSGVHATLRSAIDRALLAGDQGIILDLRGNGGGLLDEAWLVGSIFIPEGTIVSTDGRTRERRVYTATGGAIPRSVPVVVLVNRGTASAAEIVAGALQVRQRAKLVGERTFGKGVFQEVKKLPNGGALDITVGEYFLPNGRNLGGGGVREGAGLEPNLVVGAARGGDPQLRAAERLLAGELR